MLSGSMATLVTFPSSVETAYRLLRLLPMIAVESNNVSQAWACSPAASPKKRIELDLSGSMVFCQAFILIRSARRSKVGRYSHEGIVDWDHKDLSSFLCLWISDIARNMAITTSWTECCWNTNDQSFSFSKLFGEVDSVSWWIFVQLNVWNRITNFDNLITSVCIWTTR